MIVELLTATWQDQLSPVIKLQSGDQVSPFSTVDTEQETVYYMQDIKVKNSDTLARTFFDEGSNRVLIRDDFAIKAGLVKRRVQWKLLVVGQDKPETVESNMYLAELVDHSGKPWKIWG